MDTIGQVVALKGQAFAESSQGVRELAEGSPIYEGETVTTAGASNIEIKFVDDSVLAQGPDSTMSLDEYVYDPDGESGMLMNAGIGVFRMVTGKIAEENPDAVQVSTPLATIGIRGTGIDIFSLLEEVKVGCSKYEDFDVVVTTDQGTTFLTDGNSLVEVFEDGTFGQPRPYSDLELYTVQQIVPITSVEGFFYEGIGEDEGGDDEEGDGDDAGDDAPPDNAGAPDGGDPFGDEEDGGEGEDTLLADIPEGEEEEDGDGDGEAIPGGINAQEEATGEDDDELTEEAAAPGEGGPGGGSIPDFVIFGTPNQDTINGGGGDDFIVARDSCDVVFGGAGNDTLYGCDGNDTIYDSGGTNDIYGGEGDDAFMLDNITGGAVYGGSGTDSLLIDGDVDITGLSTVSSVAYYDFMSPGSSVTVGPWWWVDELDVLGNNHLNTQFIFQGDNSYNSVYLNNINFMDYQGSVIANGEGGDDFIRGSEIDDFINGGDGNDSLSGRNGDDILTGGAGNDTLDPGEGTNQVFGGDGTDILSLYDWYPSFQAVTLFGGNGTINDPSSSSSVTYQDIEGFRGTGWTDSMYGSDTSATDDLFYGNSGGDYLVGNEGDDTLFGEAGADQIFGGVGNDSLDGGSSNDTLRGWQGNDTLMGGTNQDQLFGEDGDDYLNGGDYNDTLEGGDGNDSLLGGDGDDILDGDAGDDTLDGESGDDELSGGSGDDCLLGGFDDDILDGGENDDTLEGGYGDDELYGDDGGDLLEGGFGNDQLKGEAGNDTLKGNYGRNTLQGGDGFDSIVGGTGFDFLDFSYTTEANKTFDLSLGGATLGVSDEDTFSDVEGIIGSNQDDILRGDGADNILQGGSGSDSIEGRAGDDTLRPGTSPGDSVYGGVNGAADDGFDILSFGDFTAGLTFTFDVWGGTESGSITIGSESIDVDYYGIDGVEGGTGDDQITLGVDSVDGTQVQAWGNEGDDSILGIDAGGYVESLYGGSGDDTILGRSGGDYINGDYVSSNWGDDSIEGGDGDDTLLGDGGDDVLKGDDGYDEISGGWGDDTLYGGEQADLLEGDEGADILFGGEGANTLSGGEGDYARDKFVFDVFEQSDPADQITDFDFEAYSPYEDEIWINAGADYFTTLTPTTTPPPTYRFFENGSTASDLWVLYPFFTSTTGGITTTTTLTTTFSSHTSPFGATFLGWNKLTSYSTTYTSYRFTTFQNPPPTTITSGGDTYYLAGSTWNVNSHYSSLYSATYTRTFPHWVGSFTRTSMTWTTTTWMTSSSIRATGVKGATPLATNGAAIPYLWGVNELMSALSGDGMLSVTQTGVAFVWDSVSRELEAWLVNDANSVEATYVIATLTGASDPQLDASDIFVY